MLEEKRGGKMSMNLVEAAVTRANKRRLGRADDTDTFYILIAGIVSCHSFCQSRSGLTVVTALAVVRNDPEKFGPRGQTCSSSAGAGHIPTRRLRERARTPFTEADQMAAVPTGTRSIRYWADAPVSVSRVPHDAPSPKKAAVYLSRTIRGGGSGAYGAGILNGWTESGTRPEFTMVSGVSTGR